MEELLRRVGTGAGFNVLYERVGTSTMVLGSRIGMADCINLLLLVTLEEEFSI